MEHTKHIWRAVLIFLAIVATSITAREFMVPKSFGVAGHYRFDSLAEYMANPVVHYGDESCRKCHQDKYKAHLGGKHQVVGCEVCHGPVTPHADPFSKERVKIADAPVKKTYEWCAMCHGKLESRPKDFPQIDFLDHVNGFLEQEGIPPVKNLKKGICFLCHDPHDPHKDAPRPADPAPAPGPAAATPDPSAGDTAGGGTQP